MRIDSSGNVGIGVTPESHYTGYVGLDVGDNAALISNDGGTNCTSLLHNSYLNSGATAWVYKNTDEASMYNQVDGKHEFKVAASGSADAAISWTTAMQINNSGNASIGTTSNEAKLDVRRGDNGNVISANNSISSGFNNDVLEISSSQDTSNHSYNLLEGRNGGGARINIADSGNVTNSNNSYGSLSDERVKQNITDASSQWEDIKALKVRKFKLKREGDSGAYQIGVIAQELESSGMSKLVEDRQPLSEDVALHADFGTIVTGTADNGATPIKNEEGNITGYEDVFTAGERIKEVKYSVLYMKSIKALQEAMDRIETLEAKVTALENA